MKKINLDKKEINFIGNRKIFLIISLCLVVASLLAIGIRGLSFSTEFVGGSTITYLDTTEGLTEADVRTALAEAGYEGEAAVQTMSTNGHDGFLARIDTTDVEAAEKYAAESCDDLGVSSEDVQVSTIGPNWGTGVLKSSLIAFAIGMVLILAYVWLRFRDLKMGATALVALLHDMIIVIGVYALVGHEITPNTIAAILTIMGYSLYDTIVTFHSIDDNAKEGRTKQSFWTIANHSINQVIVRTMNTTITSLTPVIFMLIFGGATLQDFAFAMVIGLIAGSYSSFALASPIYAIWKNKTEYEVQMLNWKYGDAVNTDTQDIMGYSKGVDDLDLAPAAA